MSVPLHVLRQWARDGRLAPAIEGLIRFAANRHEEFTSDAIWDLLDDVVPMEPRIIGAMFVKLARRGVVEATDRVRSSKRRECHRRPMRVWKSKVFVGGIR